MTMVTAEATTRLWLDAAGRARARRVRRVVRWCVAAPFVLMGAMQMGAIYHWATRTATWWALVPLALHALAIGLAVGLPVAPARTLTLPVRGVRHSLAARLGDRASRLRALKDTVLLEVSLSFAWPLVSTAFLGGTLRWGVGFTIACCALLVLWPLQRVAEAQRAEGERLLGLGDGDLA